MKNLERFILNENETSQSKLGNISDVLRIPISIFRYYKNSPLAISDARSLGIAQKVLKISFPYDGDLRKGK